MLVDTHCHLNFHSYDDDLEEVIARSRSEGVDRILVPGIDLHTSLEALALTRRYNEISAAVGFHPNSTSTWVSQSKSNLDFLNENARDNKVVAIGEIGLDYYRDQSPVRTQKAAFKEQLNFAAEVGLPVVIHSRNLNVDDQMAISDILEILDSWVNGLAVQNNPLRARPGVLHSFSSDAAHALKAIELGFMIGITGPVTFKNAAGIRQVVREVPLEALLIETDAPFLTPHPFRGKRNEPAYVKYVAERIAEERCVAVDTVIETTAANARKLFKW